MKCSKATAEPRRRRRISEQAGDQGLVHDPGYRPLIAKRHAAAGSVTIAVEGQ
jgi:hypothetical protein